ncbi:hypothetical protein ACIBEJ_48240 [Nonomuraea sp. NPDC050790]|uniref:hypothetical protein n=1 Tax=Nonomuraea sp. NPDC050790 TaxID=3364371 RepID=UPI0037B7CA2F
MIADARAVQQAQQLSPLDGRNTGPARERGLVALSPPNTARCVLRSSSDRSMPNVLGERRHGLPATAPNAPRCIRPGACRSPNANRLSAPGWIPPELDAPAGPVTPRPDGLAQQRAVTECPVPMTAVTALPSTVGTKLGGKRNPGREEEAVPSPRWCAPASWLYEPNLASGRRRRPDGGKAAASAKHGQPV